MGFYNNLQRIARSVIAKYGTNSLTVISAAGPSFVTSGAFSDLSFTDKMATDIAAGSQQLIVAAPLSFVPQVGDYVQRGDGVRFVINRVDTTEPADTPVIYTLIVSK